MAQETEKLIEVIPKDVTQIDRKAWFEDADRRVRGGFYLMMTALYEIYEHKLYLEGGFETIKEYLENVQISKSQFFQCIQIHQYLLESNIRSDIISSPPGGLDITKKELLSSPKKLTLLSKNIDPKLFAELWDGKEIDLANGERLDLQEIVEMTVADLKRKFDDRERKRKQVIAELREEVKRLEAERKADMRLAAEAHLRLKEAEAIEAEFGPVAQTVREKVAAIRAAIDHIDSALRCVRDVIVGEDEDQRVINEAIHLVSAACTIYGIVTLNFEWVARTYDLDYDTGRLQNDERPVVFDPHKIKSVVAKMDFERQAETET